MTASNNDNPDVLLIGSGIMSATLGAMLKNLNPDLKIQLYEAAESLSPEASDAWHNAGTGHAGICELSYTPNRGDDGEVDVDKAISIYQEFEHSKQFWGYAVRNGMVDSAASIINPVPHVAFVYGQPQVDFLRSRYKGMSAHHFLRVDGVHRRPRNNPRVGPSAVRRARPQRAHRRDENGHRQ